MTPMGLVAEREPEPMDLRRILSATSLTLFTDSELDELTDKALEKIGRSPRVEALVRSLLTLDFGLPALDLIRARGLHRRRVCHCGRVTFGWTTVGALESERVLNRYNRQLRHHFGSSAPAVERAIANAQENFGSQLRHPSGGFHEPQLVASLSMLEAVLGVAGHSALLVAVQRRLRRHRRHLRVRCQPPVRRPVDLDQSEPPGQVIVASPHVTNGPPRFHVAALMRRMEAVPS
jgi:hypothetical protein